MAPACCLAGAKHCPFYNFGAVMAATSSSRSGLYIMCVLGHVVVTFGEETHRLNVGESRNWKQFGTFTVLGIADGCATLKHTFSGVMSHIIIRPMQWVAMTLGSFPITCGKNDPGDWQEIVAKEACHVLSGLSVDVVDAALAELRFNRERPHITLHQLPVLSGMDDFLRFESAPDAKFVMKINAAQLIPEAVINGGYRGDEAVYAAARAFNDHDHVAVVYNPDGSPREVFWNGRKIAD